MAFPTTNMRFSDIPFRFFTIGRNPDTALEECLDGSGNGGRQFQKLTRVGARNSWYRTSLAEITRPVLTVRFQQAAFLHIAAAVVITIKVRTFCPGGSSHNDRIIERLAEKIISIKK
jgi:hypothetical protein